MSAHFGWLVKIRTTHSQWVWIGSDEQFCGEAGTVLGNPAAEG